MHPSAVDELFDPLQEITDAEIYNFIPRGHVFFFKHTQTSWRIWTIQAQKFRIHEEGDDDPVPNGYFVVFLLEKLPGIDLERTLSQFSLEKRNRVRIAFAKALREFYSFRLSHNDPARRNLIWGEETERCFIVDLEDVEERDHPVFSTWRFNPWRDFRYCELCLGELDPDEANYDPMVPGPHEEIEDTDEALYALAARTKHISEQGDNVATKVK
ncbi:hypothetical protein BDV38DRAFT_283881 [Aspergillus pseudotamarii]|uniref:Uncharacterized protein n=1 Tax=Aspergillus pseudotamarii TaxID=132259 RepID=A0A5N6SS23_ASPPS|nr:uncharacterized protein BDV38DRAFT_283881 [Aspergillus pseudotamarii]KAE8136667.1 hypothetical protein BDV38DRAFT_283881 [Aspergillus pseudotamarii]